jgi:hypothetical protein
MKAPEDSRVCPSYSTTVSRIRGRADCVVWDGSFETLSVSTQNSLRPERTLSNPAT